MPTGPTVLYMLMCEVVTAANCKPKVTIARMRHLPGPERERKEAESSIRIFTPGGSMGKG